MHVMYVIPHISNRILDFFWELPIDNTGYVDCNDIIISCPL